MKRDDLPSLTAAGTACRGVDPVSLLQRQLERERRARKSAEALLESKSREVYDANQRLLGLNADLAAANDELRSEVEMRCQAERHLTIYAEAVRSTGEAVIVTDRHGAIIEVNPAYQHAVGRVREELIGTRLYADEHLDATLWRALREDGHWAGEVMDRRRNGESFPSWVQINSLRDENGAASHFVCVARDMTALKRSEQQLKRLAFYDTLTQLPNRALFNDRLGAALEAARRSGSLTAVAYLDLDRFKDVNDTLGHPAGDRLLVEVAQRVLRCVRSCDTLARLGGDEFTILLTQLDRPTDALVIAERVIDAVSRPVMMGQQAVCVGASMGLAFFPDDAETADELHKRADIALYEAKQGGRGQCRVFDAAMLDKGGGRLSLSVMLDAALKHDEFRLVYQPIVRPATGHTDSVEALIRWQRPDGETILPSQFIRHAEECGLIRRIDCWVLEHACAAAARWHSGGGQAPRLCVNLSAVSVQQPGMPRLVAGILERTGLAPEWLELEITETAVIADPDLAGRVLQEIAQLGVGLSLDDFGVGYSSLSHLTRFPIHSVKLDRSFIERIGVDAASEEVIRGVVELTRKLGVRMIAEGIEQPLQQAFLARLGCELMQGFRFARPMAEAHLRAWLNSAPRTIVADLAVGDFGRADHFVV